MRPLLPLLSCFLLVLIAGCEVAGENRILSIGATGHVAGLVLLDRNGDLQLDPSVDTPVAGSRVSLQIAATRQTVAHATTGVDGSYRMPLVPVGSYQVVVDSTTLGDSLRVVEVDPAQLTVSAGDTTVALVTMGYPSATLAQAGDLVGSRRIVFEGVALNAWGTFQDASVHVADSTGTVRLTRVDPIQLAAGDSIRVLGSISLEDGQPTVRDPTIFPLGRGNLPDPRPVTTATAATAGGGHLGAAQVKVSGSRIIEARALATGIVRLTVDDGSGPLEVVLDPAAQIRPDEPLLPGASVDAAGVLVPTSRGNWQLKPRSSQDLNVSIPTIAIAEARRLPVNRLISIEGVALNAWATFQDASVHVADASGALRLTQVDQLALAAGDSVRVLGMISVEHGQPTVRDPTISALGRGQLRDPLPVRTAAAASAAGGRLDAALVKVTGGRIVDARALAAGGVRLTVDDGSGPLEILLDPAAEIRLDEPLLPGASVDAAGVLVPTGRGSWRLKPRNGQDLSVSVPTVAIAEVKRLPVNRLVAVEGVALNGWGSFGDGTLHIADPTGSIRAVQVPPAFVFAGQRVRLEGLVGISNGQPALIAFPDIPPTILGTGEVPPPQHVTTAEASSAGGGRWDAALVRVERAAIQDTSTTASGDFRLTVDDGSGPLEVLLDADAGVATTTQVPGAVFDITGLLVAQPGGRRWELKPRSRADFTAR